jgi:esterase/lipase
MKFLKWLALIILVLIVVYFFGPRPASPKYSEILPVLPGSSQDLESYLSAKEAQHHIKPENEARIIWNDSLKQPTEYSVVYLHGFSASQEEGDPVHANFARKYGCNLFLARLADHGIDTTEPLLQFTADRAWESAKEAYVIGKKLGRKVILMATSTGGTLALKLAAEFPDIAGLILLSPNIAINDPNAWLLNNHWGLQIAHIVKGRYNTAKDTTELYSRYWNNKYRMEATVQLEQLLETTMKESLFKKVRQPLLLLYYYKDEEHQDKVVKVSAMKRMFLQLATTEDQKREIAVPNAGDHVIGSYIKSRDIESVQRYCNEFAQDILQLRPVQ